MIEIVTIEQLLNRGSFKHERILSLLLCRVVLFPSGDVVSLLLIEILCVLLWLIGCNELFLNQTLPVEVFEPDVVFYFARAIETKSVARFPL